MAKLVAVCRDEEFPFERRQIPLMIEEALTMVMEIPETVISAECVSDGEICQFLKRYGYLTHSELKCALMISQKDLFALLAVSVPCVGCRRSVERLYNQLWESGQPALEPLIIATSGVLTLSEGFLVDAKLIYALFYIHGSHLNDMVDTIPKSRRNRRCILHSLETHKARASGSWMDVWDLLSQECRDEVVLIDSDGLLDTLENYLRKHRFCTECKSKVLKAYSILAGDIDGDAEKGYCATLYEGLKSCPKERHIHVVCDTDFIAHLIGRAEPELAGGRRERHARTIDIAQEEVLTCLGIHLWERLHRLWQKLRAEEQTWQMLFYLGVEGLRKSFETAVEEKQGISQLELVVEEISEAERARQLRKENKRLKKKKRKESKKVENEEKCKPDEADEAVGEQAPAECPPPCLQLNDESEKSSTSTGSHPSPRKSDDDEESARSSTCSDLSSKLCHSADDARDCEAVASKGLLITVCPEPLKKESVESSCSSSRLDGASEELSSCPAPALTQRAGEGVRRCDLKCSSGCECSEPGVGISNGSESSLRCTAGTVSSATCRSGSRKTCATEETAKECVGRCSSEHGVSRTPRKNGYCHDDRGSYQKQLAKKNGDRCGGCTLNVGPRLQNGDHPRYKYESDVYDKCCSNSHSDRGRGRGKRKGTSSRDYSGPGHLCNNTHMCAGAKTVSSPSSLPFGTKECHHLEVESDEELRLLRLMGWNSEDGLCITQEEIQEFKANKRDLLSRRQELRDKLRDQFQKMSLNPIPLVMVNCSKTH